MPKFLGFSDVQLVFNLNIVNSRMHLRFAGSSSAVCVGSTYILPLTVCLESTRHLGVGRASPLCGAPDALKSLKRHRNECPAYDARGSFHVAR